MSVKLYISKTSELDDTDAFCKAYLLASEYRRKKVDLLLKNEDKKRSLIAELLLRRALLDNKTSIKELKYKLNEYGKPYLKNIENFFFNISHSGEYVILAISNKEVGCDIEKINKNIENTFLLEKEERFVLKIKNSEDKPNIYRYWTLKESYIKNIGESMLYSYRSNVNTGQLDKYDDATLMARNQKDENIYFKEITSIDGYYIALCSYEKDLNLIFTDFNELIRA